LNAKLGRTLQGDVGAFEMHRSYGWSAGKIQRKKKKTFREKMLTRKTIGKADSGSWSIGALKLAKK